MKNSTLKKLGWSLIAFSVVIAVIGVVKLAAGNGGNPEGFFLSGVVAAFGGGAIWLSRNT